MFTLFVNGGEVTKLLGVFSSHSVIDSVITDVVADAGFKPELGFVTNPVVHDQDDNSKSYVQVTEGHEDNWLLLFTIVELKLDNRVETEI